MISKSIALLFIFCLIALKTYSNMDEEKLLLIFNAENHNSLPKKFRTCKDIFKIKKNSSSSLPTRKGLDDLKISGSGQFSEKMIPFMLKECGYPKNFYIVDLREESHGYINNNPISWYGIRDGANKGKSLAQITKEENELLEKALQAKNIKIGERIDSDVTGTKLPNVENKDVIVESISTEKELCSKKSLNYVRISFTDHLKPSDHRVDEFIAFVKSLPADYWLHFHCSAGVGRTTTIMVMFDMMHNAKELSLKDIIDRQYLIGGKNMRTITPSSWKTEEGKERLKFIEKFYEYCKTNQDDFKTTWSAYNNSKTQKDE